jgi:uncharacterized protein YbaR (Trm112 family)
MDNKLLEILACPICKGELFYDRQAQTLICKLDRTYWPIENGVPLLVAAQAQHFDK